MTKFIHIAHVRLPLSRPAWLIFAHPQHLKNLNNYHSLQAVMVGINGAACLRLKWTRERVPREAQETLAELEALMTMTGSFRVYREHLAHVSPPAVPYIGVSLSDLTFAEDGNPDRMCVNRYCCDLCDID